jgi:hypothetical protein
MFSYFLRLLFSLQLILWLILTASLTKIKSNCNELDVKIFKLKQNNLYICVNFDEVSAWIVSIQVVVVEKECIGQAVRVIVNEMMIRGVEETRRREIVYKKKLIFVQQMTGLVIVVVVVVVIVIANARVRRTQTSQSAVHRVTNVIYRVRDWVGRNVNCVLCWGRGGCGTGTVCVRIGICVSGRVGVRVWVGTVGIVGGSSSRCRSCLLQLNIRLQRKLVQPVQHQRESPIQRVQQLDGLLLDFFLSALKMHQLLLVFDNIFGCSQRARACHLCFFFFLFQLPRSLCELLIIDKNLQKNNWILHLESKKNENKRFFTDI